MDTVDAIWGKFLTVSEDLCQRTTDKASYQVEGLTTNQIAVAETRLDTRTMPM